MSARCKARPFWVCWFAIVPFPVSIILRIWSQDISTSRIVLRSIHRSAECPLRPIGRTPPANPERSRLWRRRTVRRATLDSRPSGRRRRATDRGGSISLAHDSDRVRRPNRHHSHHEPIVESLRRVTMGRDALAVVHAPKRGTSYPCTSSLAARKDRRARCRS